MQLIQSNPYRVVGLLVGATAREQTRQIKRLKQFIEAEQIPQDDASFPALGQLERTIEGVSDATAKLNLDSDKMNAALFWFYNGYSITDEPAFDSLKEGNVQATQDIWEKIIGAGDVTERSSSAYQNLSTLLILNAFHETTVNTGLLEHGIELKLKFIESDFIDVFKAKATDETFKISRKDLQIQFLNQVHSEIDKHPGIDTGGFLGILNRLHFLAKDEFLKGFVQTPIERLEKKIDETKSKRKEDATQALTAGHLLFEETEEGLAQLRSVLGTDDLTFSGISDKISAEVLQCGIDYFGHYRDTDTDPGEDTMEVFRKAEVLATGNIAKQRCEENTEDLQDWIDSAPERARQSLVIEDLERLSELIDAYEEAEQTVPNAERFLEAAKPHVAHIEDVLGEEDELFLGFSTRVASEVQGMCVTDINNLQDKLNSTYSDAGKLDIINLLKDRVYAAWKLMGVIGNMHVFDEFAESYASNYSSLVDLKYQLSEINTRDTSACYIATMAYGDYDHPQVMVLREFRDEVLARSRAGRWFIKTYYRYSPALVQKLENKKKINRLIQKSLNQLIKLIKK